MPLPVQPPFPAMEARLVSDIPSGEGWQYEPKWDGFRCLVFRDGGTVELQSKAGQPLTRYFPEMAAAMRAMGARRFVLDGELAIPAGGSLSFDDLLLRIHPSPRRVALLSKKTPALFIAFDLLVDARGRSLVDRPLRERRAALEAFASEHFAPRRGSLLLSPATTRLDVAREWYGLAGADLDGLVAKRLDATYASGERTAMLKVKKRRTADCVVGGFRYGVVRGGAGRMVGSLLLGLYDEQGLLHHVGFTSGIPAAQRADLTRQLRAMREPPGFTGRAPGGPSRWNAARSTEWEPVRPDLVVEVEYDHVTGGRFRHGTKLLRWRPDKAPRQCTIAQLEVESRAQPLTLAQR
jgi:ATP-dependent DNA ligase